MKKILITSGLIILVFFQSISQKYEYNADLINVKKDRIKVELSCPEINKNTITFHFPKSIPGTYVELNYGEFIQNLKAFKKNGEELDVAKSDKNTYIIQDAKQLEIITYLVNDTWDSKKGKHLFKMAGTKFDKDEMFMLNNGGVFGYFEGMEDFLFKINFTKPDHFYAATSQNYTETDNKLTIEFENYYKLIDCPILFAEADTVTFKISNANITIACYNEAGTKVAHHFKKQIYDHLNAVNDFVGGKLPVNNYTFFFYLRDFTNASEMIYNEKVTILKLITKILLKHGVPNPGALEHSNSSLYILLNLGKPETFLKLSHKLAIHEFMHIYTPINLHSELIGNMNYANPEFSKHLWLYEGITEYFSALIKLQGGLVSNKDFFDDFLRPNIAKAYYFPKDMSFAEMSTNILDSPYKEQYHQVYKRGPVLAMLLDFEIMKLTNGEKTLKDVVLTFSAKYGQNKSFDEDGFIDEFVAEVHPDLHEFFDNYILGTTPLDFKNGFETVGIIYKDSIKEKVPISIYQEGFGVKHAINSMGLITINSVHKNSIFMQADKIDEDIFGTYCKKPFVKDNGNFIDEGSSIDLPIIRDGNKIDITLTPEFEEKYFFYKIIIPDKKTQEQQKLYNMWTGHTQTNKKE
ncbi:hypothetical protein ACFLS4_00150 [Bacteroidota bacterium]